MRRSETVTLMIRNNDTGHVERRILGPDDYAVLYGPGMELVEETRTPILGTIRITLRPKREDRWSQR